MTKTPTPRPLWRWWLFCAALWLSRRVSWQWPQDLWAWCILPEWVGADEESLAAHARYDEERRRRLAEEEH